MQIVPFSEFARRRGAQGQPSVPADAGPTLAVADRWASLHAPASDPVDESGVDDADFWSDLQFRIAYPTHRMRRH